MAIEFYQFKWLDGATHSGDLEGAIVATNAGYAWINQNTQWKVWITTIGEVVWARERARHYSEYIPNYPASCSEKISCQWVDRGFLKYRGGREYFLS